VAQAGSDADPAFSFRSFIVPARPHGEAEMSDLVEKEILQRLREVTE
jgi:hypothetical protein